MRIAVIGAGGLGGYFGGLLARAGHEVTFVVRGRTLEALRAGGLRVSGGVDVDLPSVRATDDATSVGGVDAVLLSVKSTQVDGALDSVRALVGPTTIVVTMQNGVSTPERLAAAIGREHVAPGIARVFSMIEAPGRIRHGGGPGTLTFSSWDSADTPAVLALREALEGAGVGSPRVGDIWVDLWEKAAFMVPYALLGALSGLPMGGLCTTLRGEYAAVIDEVHAVGNACGVPLADDLADRILALSDALPPEATASLQRDLLAGRPSELDGQAGDIVGAAREHGVSVPRLELMYAVLSPWEHRARA